MKNLFKQFAKKNINELRVELARAHLIVALLSIISIVLLILGSTITVALDSTLSIISIVLLSVVAVMSLCTSLALSSRKK